MARYSQFLGRRVEVQYRAGDIVLPASGLFVADSGRSIFLEQNVEQRGPKHFRWEIPYQCLVKIEEAAQPAQAAENVTPVSQTRAVAHPAEMSKARSASAASVSGGTLLSLNRKPKTA